jgi:predicted ATPase/DNA-binding CsgD family transcriptional regulator
MRRPLSISGESKLVSCIPTPELPAALTSFIGRTNEIEELLGLLASARLVTLTGAPGMGKTRLAYEVGTRVAQGYRDGVRAVELASIVHGGLVPQALASVLWVHEEPGQPLVESLTATLRESSTLLIFDNCEHVIAACAELIETLLRSCSGVHVLATSREPLNVAGEVTWVTPPLSVPGPVDALLPESLPEYEAARLFVERIPARDFSLTPDIAEAIGEICRRLDGIPLAIELAAALVGILSPAHIAARLDERFTLLTRGQRTAPPRHRTLLAALDWSHDILSAREQTLLRRLSVFAGSWTLEAAEEVCAGNDIPKSEVLEILIGLVAKSLVMPEALGIQTRYRLLETIREYGRTKLGRSSEENRLREAHARFYLWLAEQAEHELTGARQGEWFHRLEADLPNLRMALEWNLAREESQSSLRLASVLTLFWLVRGYLLEGREWLTRSLSVSGQVPSPLRAKALWGAGFLASMLGDFKAGQKMGEEALVLSRELKDLQGSARALNLLGLRALQEPLEVRPLLEESIALAREVEDSWCLAGSLGMLGFARVFQGDFLAAANPFEECIAVARRTGNKQGLRMGLLGLGYVAVQTGDQARAGRLLEEGLAVALELDDTLWSAVALVYLGELSCVRGDYRQAQVLDQEAVDLARKTRSNTILGLCLSFLGRVALRRDDPLRARSLFKEVLSLPKHTCSEGSLASARLGHAEVVRSLHGPASARPFLEEALSVARRSGDKMVISWSLQSCGKAARCEGAWEEAMTFHREALRLQEETGHLPGLIQSLEALAGLAAEVGRCEYASRLFGAAHSLRKAIALAQPSHQQASYEVDVALARAGLSSKEFSAAWQEGGTQSVKEAVRYASQGWGRRNRASTGWASLTRAEREVVRLVAEGLTNPEIGDRLYISRRTVQTHLSHVYAKLGISSRKQLHRRL